MTDQGEENRLSRDEAIKDISSKLDFLTSENHGALVALMLAGLFLALLGGVLAGTMLTVAFYDNTIIPWYDSRCPLESQQTNGLGSLNASNFSYPILK